jgi:hypothetical protein
MIGIVGGYGDVGAVAAHHLAGLGLGRLRIGGRDLAAAARLAECLSGAEAAQVDAGDEAELDRFAANCRIVLNCAGPGRMIGDRVARAARRAGADYVDVGGDEALAARLDPTALRREGRVAVLSAGVQPGLTGLLPRWAARRGWSRIDGLTSYFGLRDVFTTVAALDYLQAATEGAGRSGLVWRNGRHPAATVWQRDAGVPLFPTPSTSLAYLTPEAERLARWLRLERGTWYSVLCGPRITGALAQAPGLAPEAGARLLREASQLDLSGQPRFVLHLLQLDGLYQGRQTTRTTVLRGNGNAALTGVMAALTVATVARDAVPPGSHFAAEILDPDATIDRLVLSGAVDVLTETDGPISALADCEECTL